MKPFWRSFWASSLASIIIGLISFLIILLIIMVISSSLFEKKPYTIKDKSILHLKLNTLISEKSYSEVDAYKENFISQTFGIREIHSQENGQIDLEMHGRDVYTLLKIKSSR